MSTTKISKKIEDASKEILKVKEAIAILSKYDCFKKRINTKFFMNFVDQQCEEKSISVEHIKTVLNLK